MRAQLRCGDSSFAGRPIASTRRRPPTSFVTVGHENSTDIEIYYEDHGSGQAAVLIHGYHSTTGRPFHAALPDARYVEIDGAPHGMIWTHADEVNRCLLDFMADG